MVDVTIPTLFGLPPGLIMFVVFFAGFMWGVGRKLSR